MGPAGASNSFLAQSLGYAAIMAGYTASFLHFDNLFRAMSQSRVDNSVDRTFRSFLSPDLLILDDLGFHRLTGQQSADLYPLIVSRHRVSSFIITSNRAVEEWLSLFDDSILGNSALDRLARAYRRPVGYSVYAFREEDSQSDGGRYPGLPSYGNSLLIGCADNAAARRAMAESLPGDPRRWLIDAGNDTNWGQVLVGNVADRDFGDEQAFADQTCYLLRAPTVQRPDLLTAVSTTPPDVDCAAASTSPTRTRPSTR